MKTVFNLFLVLTAAFSFSACGNKTTVNTPLTRQLKVLEWNIWHGGHTETYGHKACEGAIGILKKSDADVILMLETYGASDMVADSLGFYHRLLSSNLCIYSRYPIINTYTFPDSISSFNLGGVEIDMEGTRVRLFDLWIHYLPDTRLVPTDLTEKEIIAWEEAGSRDDEIRTIISTLRPMIAQSDSIPLIIGGDFNSHSHLDWTEATKDMYNHGGAVVNWPVSRMMYEAGFTDSFREINPDPAKNIGTTWLTSWHDDVEVPDRRDRIDFIYYKGSTIKAVESECYDGELAKPFEFMGENFFYPSDHGFVLTTFEITPAR